MTELHSLLLSNQRLATPEPTVLHRPTLRVAILSLLLAALFGYIVPVVDYKLNNTFIGAAHLPAGAMAALFGLLGINCLLARAPRRMRFSRAELLTVYATCLFSCLVPGRGGENFLIPNVLSPFYYATKSNGWIGTLEPNLPSWMTPAMWPTGKYQPEIVQRWFEGLPPGAPIPWHAWLVPLAAWGVLVFSLYAMLGCLGVILRAQWADREALAFPLLRLPLEMVDNAEQPAKNPFFRTPAMWVGFGIAMFIEVVNGLNLYYPDVPRIGLEVSTRSLFTEAPWNQMGDFTIRVWPLVVGISFLLTTEISFSLWFFYLFHKLQLILAYQMGFMPAALPDPAWLRGWAKGFVGYEQFGAVWAYGVIVLWLSREHLFHITRRAFGREAARPGEDTEALSYPAAFWGFVGSAAIITGWMLLAGVRADMIFVTLGTYLLVAICLSRLVVEAGLLMVNVGWMPLGPWSGLVGKLFAAPGIVPASVVNGATMLEVRGLLLPSFLHTFKLARDEKIAARPLLGLIAACAVLSFGLSVYTAIHLGYDHGALTLQSFWREGGPLWPVRTSRSWMRGVEEADALNWLFTGVGAFMTWGLMVMRARFAWFPLHPIGLVICTPFAIVTLWFSIFLGWLSKILIMKYGGTSAYRTMTPFFLGLVLGEVTAIVLWLMIDGWQGRTFHQLLPA